MAQDFSAQRVRGFGVSVFSAITARARQLGAVNLGQGFPDFDTPAVLVEAARRALAEGKNQYAVSHGEPVLRQAIALHALRFYGQEVDPETEVTVTAGASEALWCALFAFIDPGDEVVLFDPSFDVYIPNIRMAGGVVKSVPLRAPEFTFCRHELRAAFSSKTKLILVNTPHNPMGTVFSRDDMEFIADLCKEFDVMAITDEVYEHMVYGEHRHIRLATIEGMAERTLTISSGGKTFSCTGWKVGWCIGPAAMNTAVRRLHQFTVFAGTTPVQYAVAEGLCQPDDFFESLRADYLRRRDFTVGMLRDCGLEPSAPPGSFFVPVAVAGSGQEWVNTVLEQAGVATIPIEPFCSDPSIGVNIVRFCFAKKDTTLEQAAQRLRNFAATRGGSLYSLVQ